MQKVEGIDLAKSVEEVYAENKAHALELHRATVKAAIDDLVHAIARNDEHLKSKRDHMASVMKSHQASIARMQASADIDRARLVAIESGNWDALDRNFGKPKDDKGECEITIHNNAFPDSCFIFTHGRHIDDRMSKAIRG